MKGLKAIIYKSKATLKDINLDELIAQSRLFNQKVGVTGVLITNYRGFIQYIEGPQDKIDTLYASIKKDSRHKEVTTIAEKYIDQRVYSQWSMGHLCQTSIYDQLDSSDQDAFNRFTQVVGKSLLLLNDK